MPEHKNKKDLQFLDLTDEDLAQLYFLLSDEIEDIRIFCSTPGKAPDELMDAAKSLQVFLPIQQKLERFFKENHIKLNDNSNCDLAAYDIETNL